MQVWGELGRDGECRIKCSECLKLRASGRVTIVMVWVGGGHGFDSNASVRHGSRREMPAARPSLRINPNPHQALQIFTGLRYSYSRNRISNVAVVIVIIIIILKFVNSHSISIAVAVLLLLTAVVMVVDKRLHVFPVGVQASQAPCR